MEEPGKIAGNTIQQAGKRPFLLTVVCLFAFVFFGLITLLFLVALLYSGSITDMVLRYAPENSASGMRVIVYTLGGFLLHAIAFTGIVFIWKRKRLGYKIFGIASLVLSGYQLFLSQISPLTTAFYIGLVIAFGFFYKKMA